MFNNNILLTLFKNSERCFFKRNFKIEQTCYLEQVYITNQKTLDFAQLLNIIDFAITILDKLSLSDTKRTYSVVFIK